MAGQDPIKQKIQLDGEKEYSAAIKAAQRNLKTLRSELKAETAELGKNATEQQKNEAKTKSLQKQIAEQEKIVKAYKAALAEVKEKYGDNEEAIAKWEVKLNDARTALANMKNGLQDASKGFDAIQDGASNSILETKALADSFGSIAEKAGAMSDGIEEIFRNVASAISDVVASIWGDLMEVAAKADEYFDLGAFLGASATDVQKWDYAMRSVNNDISTITNLISRLKYGGKSDKVTEWFGISGENYTNDLEYAQAVLQQMYLTKDEMKKNGTWDEAMSEIFGARKTQEVDSVLSDWEQILASLEIFKSKEEGGEGMGEDELQTMADLAYQVELLQLRWNNFKKSVETKLFGELALNLTGNAQGMLDALIELIGIDPDDPQAEQKRDAAIKKLEDNLTQAFTAIGEAIEGAAQALDEVGTNLQGSENGYVKLIGDLFKSLSDVLEWIAKPDSLDQITKFFEGFFTLWIVGKGAQAASVITELVKNLGLIKAFRLGGVAATGAAAAAGTGATTAGTGVGMSALASAGLNGLAFWGTSEAVKAIPLVGLTQMYKGLGFDTSIQEVIDVYNSSHGINTVGDQMGAIENTSKEQNQKTLQTIWDALLNPGGNNTPVVEVEVEEDETLDDPLLKLAEGQRKAAEEYWDKLRSGTGLQEMDFAEQELLDFFVDAEDGMAKFTQLMSLLDTLDPETPNLPSWWFGGDGTGNQLTHDDINSFNSLPAQMKSAVAAGVSGIKVTMDGRTVGALVAPYVSEQIARDMED